MNEIDKIDSDIANSLTTFTKSVGEATQDRFEKMRGCSFFNPIPREYLAELASLFRVVHFSAKDKITTEQDVIRPFYVLIFGSATAYFDHRIVGHILSGECLGESAFFTNEVPARSAAVIADNDVIALEMSPMNIGMISDATRMFLDKALLLALFKKLQAANKHMPVTTQ